MARDAEEASCRRRCRRDRRYDEGRVRLVGARGAALHISARSASLTVRSRLSGSSSARCPRRSSMGCRRSTDFSWRRIARSSNAFASTRSRSTDSTATTWISLSPSIWPDSGLLSPRTCRRCTLRPGTSIRPGNITRGDSWRSTRLVFRRPGGGRSSRRSWVGKAKRKRWKSCADRGRNGRRVERVPLKAPRQRNNAIHCGLPRCKPQSLA